MKSLTRYESIPTKRKMLANLLSRCTIPQRVKFARMYAPKSFREQKDDFIYNLEALAEHNYKLIVEQMKSNKLNWALHQVETTVEENERI